MASTINSNANVHSQGQEKSQNSSIDTSNEKFHVRQLENGTGSDTQEVVSNDDFIDPKAERRLLWKLDLHVVPPLFLLFLLAFLDRVNIGNARTEGMSDDLNLDGNRYNVALAAFFIPYILFDLPSNLLLRKVAPSTWLCGCMAAWGLFTMIQGFVKTTPQLAGVRFLVGLAEAGFTPGCVYLISMYYKRFELQWRLSLFFCASILAGAVSGLLAYGIAMMDGVQGYKGWRWIFILEGIATIVIAGLSWFVVVDWPETAKFLNEEERSLLAKRLRLDSAHAHMDTLNKTAVKRCLYDWKIWAGAVMYMGTVTVGYSTSYFTPLILVEMAFTSSGAASNARSIPIFVTAAGVALIAAWITDRIRHRCSFIILGVVIGSIGYIIMLLDNTPVKIKYMALYFITSGGYMAQPIIWVWLANNVGGHYKRAFAAAIQISIGNVGGIIASNVFITKEGPKYTRGYATCLSLLLLTGVVSIGTYFGVRAENRKRNAGGRDYRYEEGDVDNMGDDYPDFRYTH